MNEACIPNMAARRFEEIDFDKALSEGRRYLCLDLDNTLLPQRGQEIGESVRACLEEVRASGKVDGICLISNVIIPGPRVSRLHTG